MNIMDLLNQTTIWEKAGFIITAIVIPSLVLLTFQSIWSSILDRRELSQRVGKRNSRRAAKKRRLLDQD